MDKDERKCLGPKSASCTLGRLRLYFLFRSGTEYIGRILKLSRAVEGPLVRGEFGLH